ncbi:hypothetical protein [Fimbriiglobus ruber]|uniref:Glycosyltransferase RgtA/B/C/D-like domain-containing protein n=1 Tax=Fimbriiglobus ruber TaxID=1908690 RepID=A0A225DVF0_9BACT|nr:hypothetical protein [Fimbriiglobus ruber]OWK44973.1 hypothetical protein FRUB_01304 [Fimbriiglobus ruber]
MSEPTPRLASDGPADRAEPAPVGAGFDFTDPSSPLAPFYLTTAQVVAVGLVAALFVLGTKFVLWHTDVWGHIRYGQWMAENGRVPDREPFCPWWDGRIPFTQFYTLSQLALYWVYSAGARLAGGDELSRMAGGVEALRTLHGALIAVRFGVLLAAFVRVGRSWPVAVFGLAAVALLDLSNLAVLRPQVMGQVLFAVLLWALSRERLSVAAVVGLPVLFAAWANTHGSYLLGFGLIGMLLVGRVAEWVWFAPADRPAPWADPTVRRLAAVLALGFVAVGVCNPYGFSYYARTLELGRHPSLLTAVGEWKPLTFHLGPGWHWVLLLSILVILATLLASRRPLPLGHLLALFCFGVSVGVQNRMVIWWALIVPWVLAPHWADIAGRIPARFVPPPGVPSFRKTVLAAVLLPAAFMWSTTAGWVVDGRPMPFDAGVSDGTPWQLAWQLRHPGDLHDLRDPSVPAVGAETAIAAVAGPVALQTSGEIRWRAEMEQVFRANYPGGRFTGTILATPMQGDYLMWALAPDVPVTYAHIHLFHPDFWNELGIVGAGAPGWWDVLEKYRVNLLVVEADFAPELRAELMRAPDWKIVLDESGDAAKPQTLNRQLIAVRVRPL